MYDLYAMDTCFRTSIGTYPFEVRCEMLSVLGYDGTYLTLYDETDWRTVADFPSVTERFDLDVSAVYNILDITNEESANFMRTRELIRTVEDCSRVELALTADNRYDPSDPAGDRKAIAILEDLLEAAEKNDVQIALYHHVDHWLERLEDCVRLCDKIDHPQLGVVFCGFHWYAVDRTDVHVRIEEAAEHLEAVNLSGSRGIHASDGPPATIEPLDTGELDNFAILGCLDRVGYDGEVGIQGFAVGGDVYTKLERSLETFRDMERRLEQNPHWADVRFDASMDYQ